jgi:hypothetical protein
LPPGNEIKALQIVPQPQFGPIQLRFELVGCVKGTVYHYSRLSLELTDTIH